MKNKKVNPADFLGAKILTPMEQDSVKATTAATAAAAADTIIP